MNRSRSQKRLPSGSPKRRSRSKDGKTDARRVDHINRAREPARSHSLPKPLATIIHHPRDPVDFASPSEWKNTRRLPYYLAQVRELTNFDKLVEKYCNEALQERISRITGETLMEPALWRYAKEYQHYLLNEFQEQPVFLQKRAGKNFVFTPTADYHDFNTRSKEQETVNAIRRVKHFMERSPNRTFVVPSLLFGKRGGQQTIHATLLVVFKPVTGAGVEGRPSYMWLEPNGTHDVDYTPYGGLDDIDAKLQDYGLAHVTYDLNDCNTDSHFDEGISALPSRHRVCLRALQSKGLCAIVTVWLLFHILVHNFTVSQAVAYMQGETYTVQTQCLHIVTMLMMQYEADALANELVEAEVLDVDDIPILTKRRDELKRDFEDAIF